MIEQYLFFITLGIICIILYLYIDKMRTNNVQSEEEVNRWAISTNDFKFLIDSYLNSLEYDSIDAKEIRKELLEQIRKVCPDWDDDKIIVHERG